MESLKLPTKIIHKHILVASMLFGLLSCTNDGEIANIQKTTNKYGERKITTTLGSGEIYTFTVSQDDNNCISWNRNAGEKLTVYGDTYNYDKSISENIQNLLGTNNIPNNHYVHTKDGSALYENHSCITGKDSIAEEIYNKSITE